MKSGEEWMRYRVFAILVSEHTGHNMINLFRGPLLLLLAVAKYAADEG
jgi:hypothetical protein